MALGPLGCMNNADFGKVSKCEHCARDLLFIRNYETHKLFKNNVLVLIYLQIICPKRS